MRDIDSGLAKDGGRRPFVPTEKHSAEVFSNYIKLRWWQPQFGAWRPIRRPLAFPMRLTCFPKR